MVNLKFTLPECGTIGPMSAETAAEALRQVRYGRDFQVPAKVLARIPADDACRVLPEFGRSLATYVLHTDFWQIVWLNRLRGLRAPSMLEDWREATPSEWPAIREQFLAHLDEAVALAEAQPFTHRMKGDEAAVKVLLEIALHDAYHVGQFVLLKRSLRRADPD